MRVDRVIAILFACVAVAMPGLARADFASDAEECRQCLDQAHVSADKRAAAWGFFTAVGAGLMAIPTGGGSVCVAVGVGGLSGAAASEASDIVSGSGCDKTPACDRVKQAYEKFDQVRREHNCPR
ncbi:MAG TPA: hypothetical protein VGG57_12990 [Stellaceae bacterium]|jgi:hypothetical protein